MRSVTFEIGTMCKYVSNSWNEVLEKLVVVHLVKKFTAFYGSRKCITVLTKARHWSVSWARCMQCTSSQPSSRRYMRILSYHLRL